MRRSLFALALLAITAKAHAQSSVPLEVADGGYLYVRVRVADSIEAKLLLDTGAGINTISESIIRQLGPLARDAGTHTGTRHNGEQVTGAVWRVPGISLGTFTRRDVVVGGFAPQRSDGMLSMDFFRDQPFTLDFAGGTLTLETPSTIERIASHAAAIPIRLAPNGPHQLDFFVRVCVGDSVAAEAEFDTGAGFNMLMLHPSYMKRLGLTPDGQPHGALEYYVFSTTLPEMHYCSAPRVGTAKQFVGFKEGLIFDGLVGHGAFRDRKLTIDIPNRRMLAW
jgi:hypothetical protein